MNAHRTRIKICGITRMQDALDAVRLGADAVGLVFYPPSPRNVDLIRAREIAGAVPPFVTVVGLFVNECPQRIAEVLATVPLNLLQFHGDETQAQCLAAGRPYVKAARMRPDLDLVEYARTFPTAQGLVLDAFVDSFGGSGKTFDWSLIPPSIPLPVVLSGGLTGDNVAEAIRRVRPWAVDCSSGVEVAKGIKDAAKIAQFISRVRDGEA
ncbi:MAG: phosphoribosylanthranilate isomerase [Betaproteobacteria bacterium]|nr:phosphoribosylanthranilate isomerase [Betaproteobacteria bacterium]